MHLIFSVLVSLLVFGCGTSGPDVDTSTLDTGGSDGAVGDTGVDSIIGDTGVDSIIGDAGLDSASDAELDSMASDTTTMSPPDPDAIADGLRAGILYPGEVYLAGTLSEGACYRDALGHYIDPSAAAVGFGCYFDERSAQITRDGTLVYVNTFEDALREFHCDGCPGWRPGDTYPSDPLANDTILETPPCMGSGATRLRYFEVSPDGRRAHSCLGADTWYDETGATLFAATGVRHYGWDGYVLLADEVLDTATGARATITGIPADCTVFASRAGATSGFRVALDCMGGAELWSIAYDGVAMMEGAYPAAPSGYDTSLGEAELAADESLVQFTGGPIVFEDAIIVRDVSGRSEVVYTEEMTPEPDVKVHISGLVTGT